MNKCETECSDPVCWNHSSGCKMPVVRSHDGILKSYLHFMAGENGDLPMLVDCIDAVARRNDKLADCLRSRLGGIKDADSREDSPGNDCEIVSGGGQNKPFAVLEWVVSDSNVVFTQTDYAHLSLDCSEKLVDIVQAPKSEPTDHYAQDVPEEQKKIKFREWL